MNSARKCSSAILLFCSSMISPPIIAVEFFEETRVCSATCLSTTATTVSVDLDDLRLSASEVTREYDKLRKHWTKTTRVGKYTDFLMLDVPTSLSKALISEIPIFGSIAGDALDRLKEEAKKHVQARTKKILRAALDEIERSGNRSSFDVADGAARLSMVDESLRRLNALNSDETLFDNIDDPQLQNEFQQSAIELLTTAVSDLRTVVAANQQGIGAIRSELTEQAAALRIVRAAAMQLGEKHRDLKAKIAAVQTAREQNAPSTREEVAVKIQVQNLVRTGEKVQVQLGAAAEIFEHIGAPGASRAAALGSSLVNLGTGIARVYLGDPSAILPTIASGIGLVKGLSGGGGGGPDPLLAKIVELQKITIRKLDQLIVAVHENHKEVIDALGIVNGNLVRVYERILEREKREFVACFQLVRPHAFVPSTDLVHANFIRRNESIRFSSYEEFFEHASRIDTSTIFGCKVTLGSFFTADSGKISSFFELRGVELLPRNGEDGVSGPGAQKIKDEVTRTNLVRAIDTVGRMATGHLKRDWLAVLAQPRPAYSSMKDMLDDPQEPENSVEATMLPNLIEAVPVALSPTKVRRYTGLLVGSHFYYELTDQRHFPYPPDEVAGKIQPKSNGRVQLEWARLILDASIAQQTVLAGDPFFSIAFEVWKRTSAAEIACESWPGSALLRRPEPCDANASETKAFAENLRRQLFGTSEHTNPDGPVNPRCSGPTTVDSEKIGLFEISALAARNLAAYAVYRRLEENRISPLLYRFAYGAEGHPALLKSLLGDDLSISWSDCAEPDKGISRGWYLQFFGARGQLPTPEMIDTGSYIFPPSLIGLMDVRHWVNQELAGYELVDAKSGLSAQDVRVAKELFMLGFSPLQTH